MYSPAEIEQRVEQLERRLIAEREGSEALKGMMNAACARLELERDAALAALKAIQVAKPSVKLTVVNRSGEGQEPLVAFSPDFAYYYDDLAPGTEVSLYAEPSATRFRDEGVADLVFPTMLRKMWSGGEVQAWLKHQGPLYAWPTPQRPAFQIRVAPWMLECFGADIASDEQERNHRFLEEALELVQACGASAGEAHELVDYVFGRAVGERVQEVGGVMVTLAALCLAHRIDMHQAGEIELDRINQPDVIDRITKKQQSKPAFGPLPGSYPDRKPS